jgi:uncharacterized protein with HEPN domain
MTGLRSYLADIYEQSENIMKATERMRSAWEMHCTTLVSSDFFEIIGEAAKHVPDDFRNEYPDIPLEKDIRTPRQADPWLSRRELEICLGSGKQ